MVYACLTVCILMVVQGRLTEKKMFNPISCFGFIWAVIFFLSSLHLYGINMAKEQTLEYMLIGFISFTVGYYFRRYYCKRKRRVFKINKQKIGIGISDQFELKYRLVYLFCILCIVVYLFDFSITIRYLIEGNSLNLIRRLAQDSESALNSQSGILNALKILIISPFVLVLQPIAAYDFWVGRRDKRILELNIIILILRVLTDGSRSNLIYFFLHFLIGFSLRFSKEGSRRYITGFWEKKKNRKIIYTGMLIGIVLILWTTLSRSGQNAFRYSYYYFTMEPYMFETWAEKVDMQKIVGYGLASTHGFTFAIFYILKNIGIMGYPSFWHSISTLIANTQTEWQIISTMTSRANAYVSLFWYLYLDGKVIGIIIGMIIYGSISASAYWTAIKNLSPKAICIYGFILQGLIMSFVRLQFSNITYDIGLVIILFFYRRIVNNEADNR